MHPDAANFFLDGKKIRGWKKLYVDSPVDKSYY